MSRTHKDKPSKILYPDYRNESGCKKRKEVDSEWHWMNTPSWWTRLFMNVPIRREGKAFEKDAVKVIDVELLEDIDKPNVSKKPHKYYW